MLNTDTMVMSFAPRTWARAFRLGRDVESRRAFWCRAPRIVSAEVRAHQSGIMLSMLYAEQSAAMEMTLQLPW